jgi:hypothetical protein
LIPARNWLIFMDLYSSSLDHFPGLDLFEADILEVTALGLFYKM